MLLCLLDAVLKIEHFFFTRMFECAVAFLTFFLVKIFLLSKSVKLVKGWIFLGLYSRLTEWRQGGKLSNFYLS